MTHRKSRDLPLLEYLEVLIKEYLVADTRRRIYPGRKDRAYYTRVAEGKKEKIIDIAVRNQIPHIFNSVEVRQRYYETYFPKGKLPYVLTTDGDLINYFSKGADVIIQDTDIRYGKIVDADFKEQNVLVQIKDTDKIVALKFHEVRRVL